MALIYVAFQKVNPTMSQRIALRGRLPRGAESVLEEATMPDDVKEVQCHCCLGAVKVMSDAGYQLCPLCEGHIAAPEETARRFREVAAGRLDKGEKR